MRRARDLLLELKLSCAVSMSICLCHTLSKRSYDKYIYQRHLLFLITITITFIEKFQTNQINQKRKKRKEKIPPIIIQKLKRILNTRGINDQCM